MHQKCKTLKNCYTTRIGLIFSKFKGLKCTVSLRLLYKLIAIDCSLCPVARKQHSDCNGIKDAWIRACSSLESYLVQNFHT